MYRKLFLAAMFVQLSGAASAQTYKLIIVGRLLQDAPGYSGVPGVTKLTMVFTGDTQIPPNTCTGIVSSLGWTLKSLSDGVNTLAKFEKEGWWINAEDADVCTDATGQNITNVDALFQAYSSAAPPYNTYDANFSTQGFEWCGFGGGTCGGFYYSGVWTSTYNGAVDTAQAASLSPRKDVVTLKTLP